MLHKYKLQEFLMSEDEKENEHDNGQADASKYAEDSLSHVGMTQSSVTTPCTCEKEGMKMFQYTQWKNKTVYLRSCIGHSVNGSTTYLALDEDNQHVIAKKWCLPPTNDFQTRNLQIKSLEQDFKAICQLKNSHLVPYVGMELRSDSKKTGEQLIYIRDYVLGGSLKCLQDKCGVFDKVEGMRLLRQVGVGVFGALSELHSAGVLHRDVRRENVFLEEGGRVKLVGAGLDSRLADIVQGVSSCDKQTKAQDIYAAAQVLLSIVSQETSQEIPPDLPDAAKDFFSRCLTDDEHSQWSADQLVNHGFLTDALLKSPNNKDIEEGESENEDEDVEKEVQPSTSGNVHSRLNDFEILDWIGKGAFGHVMKVQHKLDFGFYAIKQLKLDPYSVELNNKITAEVQLLSQLNHKHVVRYYNAWIESMTDIEGASESEESSDDNSVVTTTYTNQIVDNLLSDTKAQNESSIDIEFEVGSNKSQSIPSEEVSESPRVQLKQVLYIQMEFCEKSTLRQAIDNGLHQEIFRAWRLFREILEGLAHIHEKKMIHRDLKPDNIFLDSNDNVKIGDFGLATNVLTSLPVGDKPMNLEEEEMLLTGMLGTALYAAPELKQSTKVKYDQKVDIYSLGIILFEMFHAPFQTGTERYTVLTNLRDKKIIMPKGFAKGIRPQDFKPNFFIRYLLRHDVSRRPSSAQLLGCELIPRDIPKETLSRLLKRTLSKKRSPSYELLVKGCLGQQLSATEEFNFQSGMHPKPMRAVAAIQDLVVKVFRSHGAIQFSLPLLTPCVKLWDNNESAVKVMTSSGTVCHLPFDLRLPFARFIAHSGTKYIRRYTVDRVYRENKWRNKRSHPLEVIQCAFDIVTEDDTLWSDAELLVVASRAASECGLKVTVQLNHADLLRSLLLACGVPLDKHRAIYPVLVDVSSGLKRSLQLQTHLETFGVSPDNMKFLLQQVKGKYTHKKLQKLAQKVPPDQIPRFHEAIQQIRQVSIYAMELGYKCPTTLAPFLAYNATQHSGVFWQLSAARPEQRADRPAKHRARDLIAAGGRYDNIVPEFRKAYRLKKDQIVESKLSCVGFSMFLEQMETILNSLNVELPNTSIQFESPLISVTSTASDTSECTFATKRAQLARELWASGYSCAPCRVFEAEHKINIELYDDGCLNVKVTYWDGAGWLQKTMSFESVIPFIKQTFSLDTKRSEELGKDGRRSRRAPRYLASRARLPGRYKAQLRRVLQAPEHPGRGAARAGQHGAPGGAGARAGGNTTLLD